jgi:SPP1 family predicted phage head-tail adaptor
MGGRLMTISAGRLRERISIEKPIADEGFDGAGAGTWQAIATKVPAAVEDVPAGKAERLADGINIAARPARVWIRYRTDVTPDMRFTMGDRLMQIVAGPAIIGRRQWLQFMVEDYTSAGNTA